MAEKKDEKPKEEVKWELTTIPTGETLALKSPKGEIVVFETALLYLLNQVEELKAKVG